MTPPPFHIAKRNGKDHVIESRSLDVETYGMKLDSLLTQIKEALADADVAADDVSIYFEIEDDYDMHRLKAELTWYRPATPEDKQANKDWMAAREAERKAVERERVRQLVASDPKTAQEVLAEIEGKK
jgi:hypothetical protein